MSKPTSVGLDFKTTLISIRSNIGINDNLLELAFQSLSGK